MGENFITDKPVNLILPVGVQMAYIINQGVEWCAVSGRALLPYGVPAILWHDGEAGQCHGGCPAGVLRENAVHVAAGVRDGMRVMSFSVLACSPARMPPLPFF